MLTDFSQVKTATVNAEDIAQYGCPCFLNPRNEGHTQKLDWLKERFSEGLTIKHLLLEGEKKPIGFIEYAPVKYAWRSVSADNYMFVHCIWISPNKNKEKGYGSFLVNECIKDAKERGMHGVAVITSDGPFIAGKELFLKNGFEIIETDDSYELLIFKLNNGPLPKMNDWRNGLKMYRGLNILYSRQCPWVARSIPELEDIARENGLQLKISEITTAEQAQQAPSIYSVFNLIFEGKLVADHYVSSTRFLNILKKQLKLIN